MTEKESVEKYKEYLTGHISNVAKALEVIYSLDIPYVTDNIDKLRDIVKEHDASKYEEPEWSAYLHHFYPTNDEEAMMEEEFENACRHHIRANKHHWNYWCDEDNNLIEDIDEEEYKLYTIERICDWLSMAAQHDEGPTEYWNANKDYIVQPDYARELCDEIFPKIPEDFSKDMWKVTRGDLDEDFLPMNKDVVDNLGDRVKRSKTSNTIEIDTQMTNHDKQLNEMKLSQIKQKSKNQDPERINRSRKVKSTYLGMSKFGILNFKTTSQSRNGHHYQTVEFKNMKPFEDIVKAGKEIMPMDVKKQLQEQDVNVWCTDESFAFWAWAHQAYKNDFLYMDDRIPNLKKAIQAPKVNNVRLNGGACKHILSVIDYVMKPFVLLAISEDMNKFLAGNKEDKFSKQSVATQNQYDMVAQWDWSEMEEYIGKSRIEIMSDISKTLQIIPNTDKGDIITDIVGEALPNEDQGMKRQIVDQLENLIDNEDEGGNKNE